MAERMLGTKKMYRINHKQENKNSSLSICTMRHMPREASAVTYDQTPASITQVRACVRRDPYGEPRPYTRPQIPTGEAGAPGSKRTLISHLMSVGI